MHILFLTHSTNMEEPSAGQGLCKALEETGMVSELTMNGVGKSEGKTQPWQPIV